MSNKPRKSTKSKAAAALGRAGGRSVARKRGKEYMRKIGKRGARARWKGNGEPLKITQ